MNRGIVHAAPQYVGHDLPCCGIAPGMLVAGDVIDPNHRNVTCPDYVIDLKMGDKVRVHDKIFILTAAYFNHDEPPAIYFDSIEELLEKRSTDG